MIYVPTFPCRDHGTSESDTHTLFIADQAGVDQPAGWRTRGLEKSRAGSEYKVAQSSFWHHLGGRHWLPCSWRDGTCCSIPAEFVRLAHRLESGEPCWSLHIIELVSIVPKCGH